MFEPIIKIIESETTHEMEGEIFRAVQRYAIDVNKEELLKALQYDRDQYDKGYQDGLNADKWIPCSERLPEETDKYLATTCDGEISALIFNHYNAYWCDYEYVVYEVIAWQPLPAPYKGEQE